MSGPGGKSLNQDRRVREGARLQKEGPRTGSEPDRANTRLQTKGPNENGPAPTLVERNSRDPCSPGAEKTPEISIIVGFWLDLI